MLESLSTPECGKLRCKICVAMLNVVPHVVLHLHVCCSALSVVVYIVTLNPAINICALSSSSCCRRQFELKTYQFNIDHFKSNQNLEISSYCV